MSSAAVGDKPRVHAMHRTTRRLPGGAGLGCEVGREARRQAAAMSLPRYYQVESRALRGLVAACAPRPKGRQPSAESAMAALKREIERWRREAGRQLALARAAQRAIGLAPPAPVKETGKKMRRRVARALGVAAALRREDAVVVPSAGDGKEKAQ